MGVQGSSLNLGQLQEVIPEAGEMVHYVKSLLCKPEKNLSLNPQQLCKIQVQRHAMCNPSTEGVKTSELEFTG